MSPYLLAGVLGGQPCLACLPGWRTAVLGSLCVTHGLCCPLLLQDGIVWAGARARPLASTLTLPF